MIQALRTLRKLVLGETWVLPATLALAVGGAALIRGLAGTHGWWRHGGGFVLIALVALGFLLVTYRGRPRP